MTGALMVASLPKVQLLDMEGLAGSYTDIDFSTTTYRVQLNFNTDGLLDVLRNVEADSLDDHQFAEPVTGLHIRCLYVSGEHLDGGTEDTWQALTSSRSYWLQHTSSGGSDLITGTFKFQLSKDGGTTVHSDSGNTLLQCGEVT